MILATELPHVTLRPLRVSDASSIAEHANDPAIARNMRDFFPHPYALADAEAFIASRQAMVEVRDYVIAEDDVAVGMVGVIPGADVHRLTAEVGYWLGARCWRRGYATAALRALTAHLFVQHPFERLHAIVFEWNVGSVRVLEKAGYAFEGRMRRAVVKHGQVADALLYARLRGTSSTC